MLGRDGARPPPFVRGEPLAAQSDAARPAPEVGAVDGIGRFFQAAHGTLGRRKPMGGTRSAPASRTTPPRHSPRLVESSESVPSFVTENKARNRPGGAGASVATTDRRPERASA